MKIFCEVIRDLLPLYYDGVCSNESRELIEEHLAECANCKSELQVMDNNLPVKNAEYNLKEAEAVKKLSKKWKRGMRQSLLKGVFTTILTIAAILFVLFLLLFVNIKITF